MPERQALDEADLKARHGGSLACLAALALLLLAGSSRHDPLLVWNATASSPRGLYLLSPPPAAVGDFVIARPPARAARLAAERDYLPSGLPLVKTMAAGRGARVCASGTRVWIDGRLAAARFAADRRGRRLPWWSGCRTLAPGEMLLLGQSDPASFDGRYFGPVRADRIIGRGRLLWRA